MVTANLSSGIHAHIVGWGMAVPETVLTNEDLAAIVETSDEWIRERTGIKTRYIAGERETTATLGLKAAQQALEVADVLPDEIQLIIVATSTPENIFPSTANLIQDMLGATYAGAFDLSAACSGFVYAVNMAAQSIRSGSIETALVIGAETMSRVMDWQDRSTCILFGDGAGAIVLQARDAPGGVLSSVLRSDGSGHDLLGIPSVGSIDSLHPGLSANGKRLHKMHMAGGEVFKFATRVIGESIKEAVQTAGVSLHDLRLIVPHQANERIIHAAARSLQIDPSLFMMNVEKYGNTSAASIPIALVEAVEQGRIKEGDYMAFVGFGGGLSWGAMVVQWSGPQPENRFGAQRRKATYIFAFWRTRLRRFLRRYEDLFNRIRPHRGRLLRLRRRLDERIKDL
jgi:3-oxoacyl-[acyl-carrier-protein] synthase III